MVVVAKQDLSHAAALQVGILGILVGIQPGRILRLQIMEGFQELLVRPGDLAHQQRLRRHHQHADTEHHHQHGDHHPAIQRHTLQDHAEVGGVAAAILAFLLTRLHHLVAVRALRHRGQAQPVRAACDVGHFQFIDFAFEARAKFQIQCRIGCRHCGLACHRAIEIHTKLVAQGRRHLAPACCGYIRPGYRDATRTGDQLAAFQCQRQRLPRMQQFGRLAGHVRLDPERDRHAARRPIDQFRCDRNIERLRPVELDGSADRTARCARAVECSRWDRRRCAVLWRAAGFRVVLDQHEAGIVDRFAVANRRRAFVAVIQPDLLLVLATFHLGNLHPDQGLLGGTVKFLDLEIQRRLVVTRDEAQIGAIGIRAQKVEIPRVQADQYRHIGLRLLHGGARIGRIDRDCLARRPIAVPPRMGRGGRQHQQQGKQNRIMSQCLRDVYKVIDCVGRLLHGHEHVAHRHEPNGTCQDDTQDVSQLPPFFLAHAISPSGQRSASPPKPSTSTLISEGLKLARASWTFASVPPNSLNRPASTGWSPPPTGHSETDCRDRSNRPPSRCSMRAYRRHCRPLGYFRYSEPAGLRSADCRRSGYPHRPHPRLLRVRPEPHCRREYWDWS